MTATAPPLDARQDATDADLVTVRDMLRERGIPATVEWPGALAIPLDSTHDVWTGQHGWEYGSLNRLDPDGTCWHPLDTVADVKLDPGADLLTVARTWARFVATWWPPTPTP